MYVVIVHGPCHNGRRACHLSTVRRPDSRVHQIPATCRTGAGSDRCGRRDDLRRQLGDEDGEPVPSGDTVGRRKPTGRHRPGAARRRRCRRCRWRPRARSTGRVRAGQRPRPVGPVEAVEDAGLVARRDAGSAIEHGQRAGGDDDLDRRAGRVELGGVVDEVGDRPLERRREASTTEPSAVTVTGRPWRRSARRRHRGRHRPSVDPLGRRAVGDALGQRHDLLDETDELLGLGVQVVEHLPARLGSRSGCRRSTARFVRTLVSGVRSSWPASSTSRCWSSRDAASAASMPLNASPRRADLVVARRRAPRRPAGPTARRRSPPGSGAPAGR